MKKNGFYKLLIPLLILFTPVHQALSEDKIEMQGTAIIGNQELPKVLYIVPWKQSELARVKDLPLETLIDDALVPIDRESFKRQLNYYNALSDKKN